MGGVFLCILLWTCACTTAHENRTLEDGDSFSDATLPSSVGSAIVIVVIGILIYYCCCRNRPRDGFSRFNNDNEGNPPRGRSRRRRWFRRNKHQNYSQNNVDSRQPTQVIIQPVVAVGIPTENPNFGAPGGTSGVAPSMPSAPPGYDESMKSPPMPSQFMNPPMPSQLVNPPMPNQFMNPPVHGNFNIPPPMQGNFNNPPPMPGNFNNPPPMPGNFNNPPPMPSNFNNPQQNNPNAPPYHTNNVVSIEHVIPNSFRRPSVPGNFNNQPPIQRKFHNPSSMPNNLNNPQQNNPNTPSYHTNNVVSIDRLIPDSFSRPSVPGNFNNQPPIQRKFHNPPSMPNNLNNPPRTNPNAPLYYTKY